LFNYESENYPWKKYEKESAKIECLEFNAWCDVQLIMLTKPIHLRQS
jgi:hypothetical protein